MTYEILSYRFEYLFEVVILLRGLSRQARFFMEKLLHELKNMFKPFKIIQIKPNLKMIEGSALTGQMLEARQNKALGAFGRLQKI
jgi:hypothetical protein